MQAVCPTFALSALMPIARLASNSLNLEKCKSIVWRGTPLDAYSGFWNSAPCKCLGTHHVTATLPVARPSDCVSKCKPTPVKCMTEHFKMESMNNFAQRGVAQSALFLGTCADSESSATHDELHRAWQMCAFAHDCAQVSHTQAIHGQNVS